MTPARDGPRDCLERWVGSKGTVWTVNGILLGVLAMAGGLLALVLLRRHARSEPGPPVRGSGRAAARHARSLGRDPATGPRTPAQGSVPGPEKDPASRNRFHCVSIKPSLECCLAVQELQGQRFLPREAPSLPVAGCDQKKCQCTLTHHADRRSPGERRSGWGSYGGFLASAKTAAERRARRGRRSTD